MNIDDIKQSLSELSDADLMSLLKETRSSRRVSKKEPSKAGVKKAAKGGNLDLSSLLGTMSKDQIGELISQLQKQGG